MYDACDKQTAQTMILFIQKKTRCWYKHLHQIRDFP